MAYRGGKNTKYFHSLVKKKRKQSYIHTIQHNGAVLKPEEIKESVVDYFKQVFTEEEEVSYDPLLWVPNLLSEEDTQHLGTLPTLEDVKSVIFDMCPDSTAGPMGTPPPKNFTTPTIVLIPKTENPETWKDFRPISLCNVMGKILSKLMNHQVATVLPKVISPSQSGFVQGRLIADNILLAQELVHCLGANGSKNNTIFKLDMAKAYDRLNWNFLYRMVSQIGFPAQWIAKVRMLTENCWFNILINGEGAGFFKSTRGLRQGDPLSPTLFVLAAECLSRGLDNLFAQHPRLHYLTRGSLNVSHLAFADDVIIFSKGTRRELKILMDFLQHYEAISGQRINRDKSSFTVDKRTSNLRIQCIQQVTGFRLKYLPITYLGAPLFKGNKKGVLFDDLVQKIKNRISGWEKALLSHGGRLQLIKSVLSAMPTYLLQTLKPPKFITERIDRIFNKFFWGSFGNQKRMIWSSWESVCYPTEEGGFGVRKLDDVIEAFQHKLWWRFRNQQSLWSRFLLDKYCKGTHPVVAQPSYIASVIWKRLCHFRTKAEPHIFWSIGEGEISFWFDNWMGEKALCYYLAEQNHTPSPINFFWKDKSWDVDKLKEFIPP
ncbi:UNVERIFIED_CONTAM: putative mitochondrial protein [Sesamum latifolium]|uniref:Mitochondrial protein n=1 Tax=Sesamum latifolium TaxID=2727402 RepID=A0AAW2TSR7_9LAMI